MEKYKEQIEKEAEQEMMEYFGDVQTQSRHTAKSFFILGINSAISERIRIEYAIEILEELLSEAFMPFDESAILLYKKITELKNKIK